MSRNSTNNKLQIGANIAILLGLVMVAFQINQANDISSAEFLDTGITADNTRQLSILGENPNESMYRVLHKPHTATPEDYFIADRVYETLIAQIQRSIILSQEDLYLGNVRGLVRANLELFSCPYGIAYLDQFISELEQNTTDYRKHSVVREQIPSLKELHRLAVIAYNKNDFEQRTAMAAKIINEGIKVPEQMPSQSAE